jgi:hypothetical protein
LHKHRGDFAPGPPEPREEVGPLGLRRKPANDPAGPASPRRSRRSPHVSPFQVGALKNAVYFRPQAYGTLSVMERRIMTRRAMRRTSIRLPEAIAARWLATARILGRSRSRILRDALRDYTARALATDGAVEAEEGE